jgi:copper chaperone NosL
MRAVIAALFFMACASEALGPAEIAFGSETCAHCRMVISEKRFSAQAVSRAHDPLFFDDLDCLRRHIAAKSLPGEARVFVSDYHSASWIAAPEADFFRCQNIATPMNSGLIAIARGRTPSSCHRIESKEIVP